tara:strand:- start:10454 stop:11149 length:696 start_codon:yes stop_codon:yes gene_type:complete
MQDPNEYYEMQVTNPLKLRMGRKYDINENKDMVYWGSTIDGSNFRTGPTVTPSRSLYITPDEFNNYTIKQKAVPLYEVIRRDLSNQPYDTSKYDALEKAFNGNRDVIGEILKHGGKKRKNKSRKTKKRKTGGTNPDINSLDHAKRVFRIEEDINNINKEAYKETGWLPNGGILPPRKEKQIDTAINALTIAKQHMGLPNKGGIKNKSRKVKKSRRTKRKSLKKRRKTRSKK